MLIVDGWLWTVVGGGVDFGDGDDEDDDDDADAAAPAAGGGDYVNDYDHDYDYDHNFNRDWLWLIVIECGWLSILMNQTTFKKAFLFHKISSPAGPCGSWESFAAASSRWLWAKSKAAWKLCISTDASAEELAAASWAEGSFVEWNDC